MAGTIKKLIDTLIEKKTKGNPTLLLTTKTKLVLKGLNPDIYTASTPDDPAVIAKLKAIAMEMGIAL
jgi:hypothetical protein